MPSNKEKVTSYLNTDEEQAFKEFRDSNKMSNSEAVNLLIRNYLIENDETPEVLAIEEGYEKRLKSLEEIVGEYMINLKNSYAKNEKLEEKVSELQESVDKLKEASVKKDKEKLTDDEIAAITVRRVQEVWEWRHGLRKPRGCRILERLEPYKVINGNWTRES